MTIMERYQKIVRALSYRRLPVTVDNVEGLLKN